MSKFSLQLKKINIETSTTNSLVFAVSENVNFSAGQYLNISIPDFASHSKSYTIASIPSDKDIVLTVKKQGTFSSALLNLQIGAEVIAEGPEGYFFENFSAAKPTVFIAGGIGITPFMSLIRQQVKSGVDLNKLMVMYSNKTKADIVFYDELEKLKSENKIKQVINFLTQENVTGFESGRISVEVIKKQVADYKNQNYYLCGSIGFVNSMWKMIGDLGVSEESIFTEAFF